MMLVQKTIMIFFLSILLFRCNNSDNSIFIQQAENLAWNNPDSALYLLSMVDTSQLNKRQKANYKLGLIQSRAKAEIDISGDSIIYKLIDIFDGWRDTERCASATFYAGRVSQINGDNESANKLYMKAYVLADKIGNDRLKGLTLLNIGLISVCL